MEFKIGKLYKCSDHYILMIYPTREKAQALTEFERDNCSSLGSARSAGYWSKKLGCSVSYSEPNEIFVFLKEEIIKGERYINVLFGDKQGWIICKNWLRFERML